MGASFLTDFPMGGPAGSTTDDEIELRAAIEDMWILAIHPPPPSPPTADLLRIVGRDDLCDQVAEQQPMRPQQGLLESLIIAMQRTGHLDRAFEIPVAPPKPSGMSQKRYTQILSQCRVE